MDAVQLVWLITGTSSGFGKHLVETVLARGDLIIATVRKLSDAPVVPEKHGDALRVLQLDVTDTAENIKKAVDEAAAVWGQIDVLVNNAGYGLKSILEEASVSTFTHQFQTNVFGVINVTNATLPHMRARHTGTIIMMGSRSVWQAQTPFVGYYYASKAAVHSLGETYAGELKPFGIRVCVVAPGAFRTENAGKMRVEVDNRIEDYDPLRSFGDVVWGSIKDAKGDPRKAMNILVDAIRGEGEAKGRELPMYLLMGSVTYEKVRDYCKQMTDGMDRWEDIAKDLDLDEDPVKAKTEI